MHITDQLKAFAIKTWAMDANLPDDKIKELVGAKLVSGELTPAQFSELTTPAKATDPTNLLAEAVAKALAPFAAKLDTVQEQVNKLALPEPVSATAQPHVSTETKATPVEVFATHANTITNARVKSAIESYDTSRRNLFWGSDSKHLELRGQPLGWPTVNGPGMGRKLEGGSQADRAVVGAYIKWCLYNSHPEAKAACRLSDHEKDLVNYAIHELAWTGSLHNDRDIIDNQKLTTAQKASLLDDSTSGGIYAAPQILEDMIITTPLLSGELFPYVTVRNISSGRRLRSVTMGTPTFTSGVAEGTAITPFDTASLISTLDTTVYNAVGAAEIGLDFLEDAQITDVADTFIGEWGEAAKAWLDEQIAVGDGTTEPEGIFTASGTTAVPSVNGSGGPMTMTDLEALHFGVSKAFRTSRGGRNCFVGNDVNYRRGRALPTVTGANERAFGMNYGEYGVLGHPYRVATAVANTKLAFINLGHYVMYRRLGLQIKVETGGRELSLKNLKLIVLRMRFGGRIDIGGSTAVMTDLPS